MPTKIKHVAIVSENYALLGRFYEALFGLKTSAGSRPEAAVSISDGYVGMNVNPRGPGRQAGFDHFGFEVDDVERVFARARERFPSARWLKRPGNRPFAGISMHDPAGNVFDLSQEGMENRADVYADVATGSRPQDRHIDHFAIRVIDPVTVGRFYREVLELAETEQRPEDPSVYLTDGVVTLVVAPWRIEDYEGGSIERPTPDHIGFRVDDLERFHADLEKLIARNPALSPLPSKGGREGEGRRKLLARCGFGGSQLCDPDGVLIDVHAG